jgi:hypothetical protein
MNAIVVGLGMVVLCGGYAWGMATLCRRMDVPVVSMNGPGGLLVPLMLVAAAVGAVIAVVGAVIVLLG